MNDKEKNELGTINFIDIDIDSGKIKTSESKSSFKKLPEIILSDKEEETALTKEQEEVLAGTYAENEEKRKIEREKSENDRKNKLFKYFCLIFVTIALCIYSFATYLNFEKVSKQQDIAEKVTFLTNNAAYNNNIRAIFTNLRTNAVGLQAKTKTNFQYETKAKSYIEEINSQASSLKSQENIFQKYGADILYKNLSERLSQALALATYQSTNTETVDVIIKTNAYITSEESSKSSYLADLENYLNKNEIPYTYNEGKLNYEIN